MRKRIALLFAAALGLMAGIAQSADSLAMADFAHSIKLQVNGYTGNETLQNFPVLVRVSEAGIPGFHYADMSAKNKNGVSLGYDLAFFAEDGTRLASENDTWDASGESLVWVALPQMRYGTKFWMCYNVADGVMVENPNPWGDYVGVWHLGETGGQNKPVFDSTVNGLVGTNFASSGSSVASGAVGKARKIANDNAHDKGIIVNVLSDPAKKAAAESLGTDFHASFWMVAGDGGNNYVNLKWGNILGRRKGDQGKSWGFAFHGDNDVNAVNKMRVFSGATTIKTTTKPIGSVLKLNDGVWKKVDVIWKYATNNNTPVADVYTNGVFVESVALNEAVKQENANIGIGCSTQDTYGSSNNNQKGRRFNGSMDEVRLRPGVVSADWIKADFDTVNDAGFVTVAQPDVLVIAWANGSSASPGVSATTYNSVTFGGMVRNVGETAESCAIGAKVWAVGTSEPTSWRALANGLVADDAFSVSVGVGAADTEYNYILQAVGNDGVETNSVSGTFTTAPGLAIAWSAESGATGFSQISYTFATIGGSVSSLGGARVCDVQYKVWESGGDEPSSWTTFAQDQGLGDAFGATISERALGTTYAYRLRGVGDNGDVTAVVSGTFTTLGNAGEEIGSPYTHFFDDGTNAMWVANDFERFLPFTVTGYTGTETLTNFPVLVDVRKADTNGFSYDDFYHYDGKDMAFVDELGHIIPHEIDTWNKNGMSLIWVRLPEMNNGTTFTMCYRSPLVDPLPPPENTFERYVGVWHMNETQNGVVWLRDSTTNNLPGETHAQSLAGPNVGQMIGGNARRVAQQPGTSANYGRIIVFDHDDILRTGVGNVFTYSGWYKLTETPPKWSYLVGRKANDQDRGWGIQYEENSTTELRVWSGSTEKGKFQKFATPGAEATGWNYWTFVFDGGVNGDGTTNRLFHAYLNGRELASTAGGFALNYDIANDETADYDNLCIGGQQTGTGAFNGWVDEARFSKGVRSPDWIKAEYDSMRQKDAPFVTKGAQVSNGAESLVPVVVWERGNNLPDTILDLSYAYVQFAGTVTFCGAGATECRVEYQIWPEGESRPAAWTVLKDRLVAYDYFAIPVTGLKQDMAYNFRIRAVNVVDGQERQNREHEGTFRTHGNVNVENVDGELYRLDDKFVHLYRAGSYIFTAPDYATNVEILVVGGGGGGGYKVGGGGGGGGLFHARSFPVSTGGVYRVHVGQGGVAASNLTQRSGSGEMSYFALASDEAHPLIAVPGGGGGGSYLDNAETARGADGASGGGGTYAFAGGAATEGGAYGHAGGAGNDALAGGSTGKTAAGGGGGAGRAGLTASFDSWWGGGSGGVGFECAISGETLFYGAGGGGGYKYKASGDSFTKPGAGGSGIGGDAADVQNGVLATSGVPNTGAGGGGGSMTENASSAEIYWQGGNGGDGIVLISYEAHGRDPISEEPRISLTDCLYTDERGYAIIDYRAYWAGIQSQLNDIYVLYSTVSEEDVRAGNGEMVKCAESKIGIGWLKFTPPEKGHTYWVRLVARKDANSFMYSDEIASFEAPAIRINGVTWTESKATEISAPDTSKDFATVLYDVYDTDPDALLYCYWSENRADLEGNSEPSGEGVHFLNVTDDIIENGDDIVHATRFRVSAALGLERNKQYYFRLALANEAGTKFNLSPRIMPLWTAETAYVVYPQAVWANHVVTADFMLSPASYDPASVELLALYSGVLADITDGKAIEKASVKSINLGTTDQYPHGDQTLTQFPLSSTVTTNYFTRLALRLPDGKYVYSARYQEVNITAHIPENMILITARAIPQKRCYGDEPPAFGYEVTYAGYTNTVAWAHRPSVVGEPACVTITDDPAQQVAVTSQSPSGQYRIIQNTLALSNPEPYVHTVVEPVVDPETGEQVIDPETHEPVTQTVTTEYEFMFAYARARYTITNAVFSAAVADVSAVYTGEPQSTDDLVKTETGVRNAQPVSYQFRGVGDEWGDAFSASYTDVGTHTFEFKASAPNHDDTYGMFKIAITPAPLSATIRAENLDYLGVAQTPQITTNVTGLVRPDLNPLVCQFRDEAGEWQSDVPSFTKPGEYKLFFRVSAPNHATFTTNCVFKIEEWDYRVNMDGATGYGTPIYVSDPGWLLQATGWTSKQFAVDGDRYAKLDEVQANGLKLWQNYVIDRADLGKRLVAAVRQSGDRVHENSFVVYFPGVAALRNTGLDIRFRVDSKLRRRNDTAFVPGESTDKYEMNVPLGPEDPTGLYVFNIVLSPTNELDRGQSVLASVSTVGVLRVSSALTNTIAAAPWMSMANDHDLNENIAVRDAVNPNGLATGDMILAYDNGTGKYNGWSYDSGSVWKALASVTVDGVEVKEAATTQFTPGDAFWLARSKPAGNFHLVGRYTGCGYAAEIVGGTTAEPGATLVANPTMSDIALGDIDWQGKPLANDTITVPREGLAPLTLTWRKGAWGYTDSRYDPQKGRIVSTRVTDVTIPAGTGFWYTRRGEGFTISWPLAWPDVTE